MSAKQDREKAVFSLFADALGLSPRGSFRRGLEPEPEIVYTDAHGVQHCFELVEILDQAFARTVGQMLTTKAACYAYFKALAAAELEALRASLGDADVHLDFHQGLTDLRRRECLPKLFAALRALPAGFERPAPQVTEGPLAGVVRSAAVARIATLEAARRCVADQCR